MASPLIRTIHAAAREIGLDTETRHDLQLAVTGKQSLVEMTEPELRRVIDALQARGWKPKSPGERRQAARADTRYAHVLWGLLARGGVVDTPGAAGLNAFVRSRFGAAWGAEPIDIDVLRDSERISAVIRALRAMCARNGIEVDR